MLIIALLEFFQTVGQFVADLLQVFCVRLGLRLQFFLSRQRDGLIPGRKSCQKILLKVFHDFCLALRLSVS
jgi:hypothetical protein